MMIKPGEEIIAGANERFQVVDVPFEEEDKSPFVGLLQVEAAWRDWSILLLFALSLPRSVDEPRAEYHRDRREHVAPALPYRAPAVEPPPTRQDKKNAAGDQLLGLAQPCVVPRLRAH